MSAAVNASRSGDLLNDRYELCELVESRDTNQLYSARDTRSDRLVHVALLRPELALRAGVAQRFVKLPTQLASLDHPNVVRVWSVESDVTGIPFVVEEPRSGQPLSTMIESFPDGMPLGVAMNLLVPIAEAMAAAHGRGLVHGALDAAHVLLIELSGTTLPKIFGFGTTDKKAGDDVRALGALLYSALSGQSADAKRRAPLDELAPHLPLELTELVERCLASEDERPADARMLCDELSTLRQRLGGHRPSAVSTERAVVREAPVAKAEPKPEAKPEARRERERVRVMERAETAPVEPPAGAPVEITVESARPQPQPTKVDPHSATCFDVEPPIVESKPARAAPALDRSSVDFPLASSRPPQLSRRVAEAATQVDDPAQTREARAKAKDKPRKKKPNEPDDKAKQGEPGGIAVAGPARLAAAFAPLEGADNIEQGETREAELGRAFRQAQQEERQTREARLGRLIPSAALASAATAKPIAGGAQQAQATKSDKKRDPARPSAAEVIALGQIHAQQEATRERRSRFFSGVLLLLFCLALARAVPLLTAGKAHAAELLGTHAGAAAAAFTALSVIVLIRTWALQIQSKAMLLKPVTYSLKVVVLCAAMLCVAFMMPEGALGSFEGLARRVLPWASAGFFMFLGFYGMMRGIRETQVNAVAGIAMTLAYFSSFAGSYSIASNVIAPDLRSRASAAAALDALDRSHDDDDGKGTGSSPQEALGAAVLDPEAAADIAEAATMEDGLKERHGSGANEEDDMESLREMGNARKRNSARMNDLKDKLPEVAK